MRRFWGLTFELPVVLPQIALIWLALVLIVQAILASSGPGNSKDEFVRASVSANQRLSAYCYPQWIEEYLLSLFNTLGMQRIENPVYCFLMVLSSRA